MNTINLFFYYTNGSFLASVMHDGSAPVPSIGDKIDLTDRDRVRVVDKIWRRGLQEIEYRIESNLDN